MGLNGKKRLLHSLSPPQSVGFCGLCIRQCCAWITYAHIKHFVLLIPCTFCYMPATSIIFWAIVSFHLFHSHAQIIHLLTSLRWTGRIVPLKKCELKYLLIWTQSLYINRPKKSKSWLVYLKTIIICNKVTLSVLQGFICWSSSI